MKLGAKKPIFRERSFTNLENPDKSVYELGMNALQKGKDKGKIYNKQVAYIFLCYLFALRIGEALAVDLNRDRTEGKSKKGKVFIILRALNEKVKFTRKGKPNPNYTKDKEKYPRLFISNEWEQRMFDFIMDNLKELRDAYKLGEKCRINKMGYPTMAHFCERYFRLLLIGYDKDGNEIKKEANLNLHALRHLRAYTLNKRYGKEITKAICGWKTDDMFYYYTDIARSLRLEDENKQFGEAIDK